jgi:hypothetical protein
MAKTENEIDIMVDEAFGSIEQRDEVVALSLDEALLFFEMLGSRAESMCMGLQDDIDSANAKAEADE